MNRCARSSLLPRANIPLPPCSLDGGTTTSSEVEDFGAHFDIILGPWGDDTSPADRTVALLEHRLFANGPAVMVIDAKLERGLDGIAAQALTRAEVIGTPIADNLFAIYDAIVLQDPRVKALAMEDDEDIEN